MSSQRAQFNIRTTTNKWQVTGTIFLGDQLGTIAGMVPGKVGFRTVIEGFYTTALGAEKNDGSTGLPTMFPDPAVDGLTTAPLPCFLTVSAGGTPLQLLASSFTGLGGGYKRGCYLPSGLDLDAAFSPVNTTDTPGTGPFFMCFFSIWGRFEATPKGLREQLYASESVNGVSAGYIADDVFSSWGFLGLESSTVGPGTPPSNPVPIILPFGAPNITTPTPLTVQNFQEPLTSVIVDSCLAVSMEGELDESGTLIWTGSSVSSPVLKETNGPTSTVVSVVYPPFGGLLAEEIGGFPSPLPYLQFAAGNGLGIDIGLLPQSSGSGFTFFSLTGRLRPGAEVADMISKTVVL